MQTLRKTIESRVPSFGLTNTGADWCVKALHPSDPMTEVRGIPDHSAVPSLTMNYQSAFTLSPAAIAEGTWSFDMTLVPHPIQMMVGAYYDSETPLGEYVSCLNSQIDGADHVAKFASFITMAQRWRLCYQSVTVYQDGPDLANQGTIVVSQTPCCPRIAHPISNTAVAPVCWYQTDDKPSFEHSQAMPNAYLNRSREGAYVPLKLTETCQDWVSEADSVMPGAIDFSAAAGSTGLVTSIPAVGTGSTWPFGGLVPYYASAGVDHGDRTSPLLNGTVAHISARNLATTTSYTFHVRQGIELQVVPGSQLSPQLKLSPKYDRRALDVYYLIARELKDAYPADYNDLGKIWDVISIALKSLSPLLPMPLGVVAGGTAMLGDYIRQTRKSRKMERKLMQQTRQVQTAVQASSTPQRAVRRRQLLVSSQVPQRAVLVEPAPSVRVVRRSRGV